MNLIILIYGIAIGACLSGAVHSHKKEKRWETEMLKIVKQTGTITSGSYMVFPRADKVRIDSLGLTFSTLGGHLSIVSDRTFTGPGIKNEKTTKEKK